MCSDEQQGTARRGVSLTPKTFTKNETMLTEMVQFLPIPETEAGLLAPSGPVGSVPTPGSRSWALTAQQRASAGLGGIAQPGFRALQFIPGSILGFCYSI